MISSKIITQLPPESHQERHYRVVPGAGTSPSGSNTVSTPGFMPGMLKMANPESERIIRCLLPGLTGGLMPVIVVTRLRLSERA
jgi:hypothetical protein